MLLVVLLILQLIYNSMAVIPSQTNFNNALQQQNLHTVLLSIEERLRNLDSIYSMQFSPTIENKIEIYARKFEAMDAKIQRLENIVTLQLDKLSENISTKNFKDDIFKTNTLRKIDSIYEGITHRLSYVERKFETQFNKINNKMENIFTKLGKMEETMITRDADIEAEINDAIAAIDDMKSTCNNVEESIFNSTQKHTLQISNKANDLILQQYTTVEENFVNISNYINKMQNTIEIHKEISNETNDLMKIMKNEFKVDMNDYANKVADMYSEIIKFDENFDSSIENLETILNSTKTENQNNLRTLIVQIGKLQTKENTQSDSSTDLQRLSEINKKLDVNFEKMFLSQDLFLESCHRLQMDESQIESKISLILEKLMETFEKKSTTELKDVKNLQNSMKTHDSNVKRNLHQINNNINQLFNKCINDNKRLDEKTDTIGNALYMLIENKEIINGSSIEVLQLLQALHEQIIETNSEIIKIRNDSIYVLQDIKNHLLENITKNDNQIIDLNEKFINYNSSLNENLYNKTTDYINNTYKLQEKCKQNNKNITIECNKTTSSRDEENTKCFDNQDCETNQFNKIETVNINLDNTSEGGEQSLNEEYINNLHYEQYNNEEVEFTTPDTLTENDKHDSKYETIEQPAEDELLSLQNSQFDDEFDY